MSDRTRSPRPSLAPLNVSTSSSRSRSNSSSSPLASPSNTNFAFPAAPYSAISSSPSSSRLGNGNSSSSPYQSASSSASTSRFHDALSAFPTASARHQPNSSTSSEESIKSDGGPSFRFPTGSASPTTSKAFDGLQREFSTDSLNGWGNKEARAPRSRDPSPQFGRSGSAGGGPRFYDEPETLEDSSQNQTWRDPRRGGTYQQHSFSREGSTASEFSEALDHVAGAGLATNGSLDNVAGIMGGFGRPASMDMSGDVVEGAFDFLLSPPPSHLDPTLGNGIGKPGVFPSPNTTPKGKERVFPTRERTFPAPLLLSRDRPFGGTSSPVPGIATTAPLSLPRKSSVSTGSSPGNGNAFPQHHQSSGPGVLPRSSSPWSTTTPPTSIDMLPRANPPYQRHAAKTSSSLSQSQSSITYNHSQSPSVSSNVTASPVISNHSTMSSFASDHLTASSSSSLQHATSLSDAPLPPQALLLHVLSLRSASAPMSLSQSQGPATPTGNISFAQHRVDHQRIRSVGSTTESGDREEPERRNSGSAKLDTVDLSHKRIAELPVEVIRELSEEVEKLALGYNLLRELPREFGAFAKLRYLNVRVNLLTTFPQVLCEMPSLEILDISRNKIKKLPVAPGTLLNLKVFSIAKNRIKRLPPYIAVMSHLKVLKIDHNPLEWPPKEIAYFPISTGSSLSGERPNKVEDADDMQRWLHTLTRWIKDNADRRPQRLPSNELLPSDDERLEELTGGRPNAMARTESGRLLTSQGPNPPVSRLRTTPPATRAFTPEDHSLRVHSRNASHSTSQEAEPRSVLRAKKSLPDLRQPHADILAERRTGVGPPDEEAKPKQPPVLRRLRQDKHPGMGSHTQSARAAIPTQASMNGSAPTQKLGSRSDSPVNGGSTGPRPLLKSAPSKNLNASRRPNTPTGTSSTDFDSKPPGTAKRPEIDRNPSGGFDRNSGAYFRRLSMLPASTISKTVPMTLLEFADAIRGILFALSQIYTALRQFVVFASQDRLPASVARLMGSADGSMSLLINALDRFDSLSRRSTPSPAIVRDIFVTCQDNVATFGKLVAALVPELKALVSTADVRYTRTLLLMLYGSTGEIANSWNKVAPLLSEMTVLSEDPSLATLILHPPTPSPTLSSSTSSRTAPGSTGLLRTRSRTRRHAGSFSVEDVELGAVLPPAPTPPASAFPEVPFVATMEPDDFENSGTIKARPKKSRGAMSIKLPGSLGARDLIVNAFEQPLTPGPSGLMFGENSRADETPMPFSLATNTPQSAPASQASSTFLPRHDGPPRLNPSATMNADEQFLDLVDATTSVAYDVYGMLLESFDEAAAGREGEGASALVRELGPRRTKELTDLCILGNEVTTKLTGSWGRVRGVERNAPLKFSASDAKRLGEDSYAFVQVRPVSVSLMWSCPNDLPQTVIRFAKLVKAISLEHGFAPRVREGVGQLTISTRELAKCLSATSTSFRPSPSRS
ncbi:hypothetical protein P7C70_g3328, partial [Phenoliferia sp. Uapishka_3]